MSAQPVSGGMGMALLQKMGWRPGEGLGKNKEGTLEPLQLEVKLDKRGLISEQDIGQKTNKTAKPIVPAIKTLEGTLCKNDVLCIIIFIFRYFMIIRNYVKESIQYRYLENIVQKENLVLLYTNCASNVAQIIEKTFSLKYILYIFYSTIVVNKL